MFGIEKSMNSSMLVFVKHIGDIWYIDASISWFIKPVSRKTRIISFNINIEKIDHVISFFFNGEFQSLGECYSIC